MSENHATLEIIAPTIEEAIEEGLRKLGLSEDMVDIDILDEGNKGLFGLGARQARVKLTIKSQQDQIHKVDEISSNETVQPSGEETLPEETSVGDDHILTVARETVGELLQKMKIDAEVTAYYGEADDRSRVPIHVDIHGQDLSILIGRKAETLNALQFISKLIIGKELEHSVPLVIDVEGYRNRRERQIRQLAQRVSKQVIETGRSQALEPMPPNERRLIHIELRKIPDVTTESTGQGNKRKVIIYPKG